MSLAYGVVVSNLLDFWGPDFTFCKTKLLNQWSQSSPLALPFQDHEFYDLLFKKKKKLFTFGCARSSLLRTTFSSCSEQGLVFIAILSWGMQASHWGGFFCCTFCSFVLGPQASVVVAHGLGSCYEWTSVAPQHVKSSWSGIELVSPALVGRLYPLKHQGSLVLWPSDFCDDC